MTETLRNGSEFICPQDMSEFRAIYSGLMKASKFDSAASFVSEMDEVYGVREFPPEAYDFYYAHDTNDGTGECERLMEAHEDRMNAILKTHFEKS